MNDYVSLVSRDDLVEELRAVNGSWPQFDLWKFDSAPLPTSSLVVFATFFERPVELAETYLGLLQADAKTHERSEVRSFVALRRARTSTSNGGRVGLRLFNQRVDLLGAQGRGECVTDSSILDPR